MHTIGMALLIGSLGLINLRVLGYKVELPILGTRDLLPLAWLGFTINAISGAALFVSDAVYFFSSYTFRIKMLLIILGGINAALLSGRIFREARAGETVIPTRRHEGDRRKLARVLARRRDRRALDRLHAVGAAS